MVVRSALIAVTLILSSCTCGDGGTCHTSADCGSGRVCLPTGTCAQSCTSNGACIAGEKCSVSGGCIPASGCGTDGDCASGQLCQAGTCGAKCTATSCGSGRTCAADGHCVVTSGSGGGSGGANGGGSGGSGGGTSTGGGAAAGGSGAGGGMCVPSIQAHLRDFRDTHPDFEKFLGSKKGIVQAQLGVDHKPVYGPEPQTAPIVTSGQANFDQWYRDVAGVNQSVMITLPLTEGPPKHFVYDNSTFFPLDGMAFGNEGRPHNFHFTTEIHGEFTYEGGELFTFRGDDDVFVFVNNKLALDLGGVHSAETGTIDFDAQATMLNIVKGQKYPLDVFHAERHTTESNFRIETTIGCLVPAVIN